jgi:rhamnogalacturonyl hydrolase YesR
VYAALVWVLDIMPTDASGYDEYMSMFKQMTVAVNKVQRKDGFWNVSLHDPRNFGGKETSGTALFVYGMGYQ